MPPDALTEVLRIPADKLPQFVGTEVGTDFRSASGAAYVIVKVTASKPGEPIPPAQRDAQARAINQQAAAAAEYTYAEGLKRGTTRRSCGQICSARRRKAAAKAQPRT